MNESGRFSIGGDLEVSRLGFGAMRITGPGVWGEPEDHDEAIRVLRRAVELGVDFIDTADSYGPFVSEDLIAEALYPYPEGLVIATKGGFARTGPGVWEPVGRPEYLRQCVHMSLRRLKLERIDLYQFHRPDPKVPFTESVGALKELQNQGLIRHIGLSNVTVEELAQARGLADIATVQNRYNLTDRASEDVLSACEAGGIGFIPWAPVAGGELARPGGPLDRLAQAHDATVSQLSLAWTLHRSPVMLPIPGTSKVAHLEENMRAASLALSEEEWEGLEKEAAEAA
ncbi:MAG TPA: aldo/keto reductase [Acidimicrobiales bacterium]|nr:aldo/keto reductase [Acidimicrobiales bacterium]